MARMSGFRRSSALTWAKVLTGVAVLAVLGLAWGMGLFLFAESLPLKPDRPQAKTDAIVVLTGGTGRLEEGLELLARDRGERLFVSGVFPGVDVARLLSVSQQTPSGLESRIDIGDAENTVGNARETALWIRSRGYDSLRLVTSSYHMPRSLMEFARVLPDITILPHPVLTDNVKQDEWWAWPGTAQLIGSEFNKFLITWIMWTLASYLDRDTLPAGMPNQTTSDAGQTTSRDGNDGHKAGKPAE